MAVSIPPPPLDHSVAPLSAAAVVMANDARRLLSIAWWLLPLGFSTGWCSARLFPPLRKFVWVLYWRYNSSLFPL